MARFSLKWLFVSIAFVALLCGWLADRLRLMSQLENEKHNTVLLEQNASRDRQALLNLVMLAGSFQYFGIDYPDYIPGQEQGAVLLVIDGEVDEMAAFHLVGSRIPNITLKKVRILPEAKQILAERYDHTFDGEFHRYRLRRP